MTALEIKKYIYENNKIPDVLESIGCKNILYHEKKEYFSCSNAVGGDCNNNTAINIKNNQYLNYRNFTRSVSYDDGEDLISLIEYNLNIDFRDAMKYLHKLFGLTYEYKSNKPKKINDDWFIFTKYAKKKKCIVNDFEPMDEDILSDFVPHVHIDIFREGIIKRTIKKFELGYSYRWKRTIFPVRYWMDGSLMGYNARSSIQNCEEFNIPKYFITPGMKKDINLYGLWQNYKHIQENGIITVFEAEKSVLKRDSLKDFSCVALQGHFLSDEQVRVILGLNIKEVVIAMDKDVPLEEVWSMCERFYGIRKVSYIYDKYNVLGPKDSPADAPNKVYKILFEYRRVYDLKCHNEFIKNKNEKNI